MISPLYILLSAKWSEVIDRIPGSFDPFVLPFAIGIVFFLCWVLCGLIRLMHNLPASDRKKFFLSLVNPKILAKDLKDCFCDCLLHTKIWKRKPLLGYMHSAIAFGWFLLIVLGHLEVYLFVPKHLAFSKGALFYPIFYRYFIWVNPAHITLKGSFFFFLMDFCLLYVLSGIGLAMFKRLKSIALGMKHTTKPSLFDRVALYCLWSIFPLRLIAESFTADLSGGSFLTVPINNLLRFVFGDHLYFYPSWWAYSLCLGLFFISVPFSRYMHIFTEPLLILLRNAGIRVSHPRKGFAEAEVYACSSCGLCLDACPMNVQKKNLQFSSVYLIRFLRRHNEKKINRIADKCLMCDKCHALCPVGVDAPAIRRAQRSRYNDALPYNYSYLSAGAKLSNGVILDNAIPANAVVKGASAGAVMGTPSAEDAPRVMYFAGCMSHLTPKIIKSVERIFAAARVPYIFADKDGGLCCGRPLMLAGKNAAAREVIEANRKMILDSGCKTLVLSCPICLKVFRDEYALEGIEVLHYTQYVDRLISEGRLKVSAGSESLVYHDPCELGRGCGIYEEPRRVLSQVGTLVKAAKEGDESVCCGGSLGSLTLNAKDRREISAGAVANLLSLSPDKIVTACPLCYKTFREATDTPVVDFAEEVVDRLS